MVIVIVCVVGDVNSPTYPIFCNRTYDILWGMGGRFKTKETFLYVIHRDRQKYYNMISARKQIYTAESTYNSDIT